MQLVPGTHCLEPIDWGKACGQPLPCPEHTKVDDEQVYGDDNCCKGCGAHVADPHDPGCSLDPDPVKPVTKFVCISCEVLLAEPGDVYCLGCREGVNRLREAGAFERDV